MNLVLYRMEDTERVRYKLREKRRRELRETAERQEEKEKQQMERIERNKKWRDRKNNGGENLNEQGRNIEKKKDEKKQVQREKNMEWRRRRFSCGDDVYSGPAAGIQHRQKEHVNLSSRLQVEIECPYCQAEMFPPTKIFQCGEGHNLCQTCKSLANMKVRNLLWIRCRIILKHHRYVLFAKGNLLGGTLRLRKSPSLCSPRGKAQTVSDLFLSPVYHRVIKAMMKLMEDLIAL